MAIFMNRLVGKSSDSAAIYKSGLARVSVLSMLLISLTGCFDGDDDDKDDVNASPVAVDDMLTTQADIAFEGSLTASDDDGDTLMYALVEDGSLGSVVVNANGTFTYSPNAQVIGNDSFTFSVSDGVNPEVTGTVSVMIEAQQVSFSNYTRDAFNQAPTDKPLPLNGREFTQDAAETTFDDLLIDD